MAIDTREKRASAVTISLYAMGPPVQAGAAGIDLEDRQIIGYGYSGIVPSGGGADLTGGETGYLYDTSAAVDPTYTAPVPSASPTLTTGVAEAAPTYTTGPPA